MEPYILHVWSGIEYVMSGVYTSSLYSIGRTLLILPFTVLGPWVRLTLGNRRATCPVRWRDWACRGAQLSRELLTCPQLLR